MISTSGRMDDVKQRNTYSCPFMRGLVPASSNCLTWTFTLPVLMSPLGFFAVFWREREEQYHTEGQCHMKEQYHITAVNLRDPGSKCALHGARPAVLVVLLWSVCSRNLIGLWLCWTPLTPTSGRAQHPAVWQRKEGPAAWAGHLVMLGISAPSHTTAGSSYKE